MIPGALLLENVHEPSRPGWLIKHAPRICIYVGLRLNGHAHVYDYLVYDSFLEQTYIIHSTVDATEFGWDEIA